MAVYEYTARDESGNEFGGTYNDINNVAVLRDELAKTGYTLVRARREKGRSTRRRRVNRSEVVAFAYKFAGMYSAGLSITRCLETLEEQAESQTFKLIIGDIRESVEAGSGLGSAFGKHKSIFSDFFLGMLQAGEASGRLGETLEMSAVYLENQADLKRKVRSAFAYPAVVGATCVVVIGCLLVFVVPIFAKLYKQLHVQLPFATQILVGLSSLIRGWWWAILIVAAGAVIGLRWLSKNPGTRAKWDAFKLNMPVFAKLNRMVVISHFTRTFAMLASVGVSLVEALDVASVVAHNHKVSEIAKELQGAISAGNSVARSLKNYDIFPPMIVQMASSGEEAGELAQMLAKGADFLDKDIERTVNALIVKLEPALTIIMGLVVGLILMGVYLPMFDYMRYLE